MNLEIKVGHWGYPHLLYLPYYIAINTGIFEKRGLDVQTIYSGNDQDVYKAVLKGKVDFAISDPLFSIENEKVLCSGIVVNRIGIWGISHNPAIKKITRLEDLVGLRIGSLPSPATTYSLIKALKEKNKRLLKSLKIIEAPIGNQQTLLSSNKADVILELEPMVSLAESYGIKPVFSLADYYKDFAFTGITHSKNLLEENPEAVKKFMVAINKGLKVCLRNEKVAIKVSKELFKTYPEAILKKAYARLLKAKVWPENTTIDKVSWQIASTVRKNS